MKRPLSWHEQCLKNMSLHLQSQKAHMERTIEAYETAVDNMMFYSMQIKTAKREKREGFDADRFLVNRKNEKRQN